MTCPHIGPWFRIGGRRPIRQQCGLTKRACRPLDACPAEMGEWGAWRAVVNEIVWAGVIDRATSSDPHDLFTYLVWRVFGDGEIWCKDHFNAVGWSP